MGLIQVQSPVLGPSAFRKNFLINGNMLFSQRGSSFSVPGSHIYTVDRWAAVAAGANATITHDGDVGAWMNAGGKFLSITGASGNTSILVEQRIESQAAKFLANQTVTLSFYLYDNVGGFTPVVTLSSATAADNFTGTTVLAQDYVIGASVSGNLVKCTWTGTIGNCKNGLKVALQLGPAGAGVVRALTLVQLELGAIATPFEFRHPAEELALCQRYYETNGTASNHLAGCYASNYVLVQAVGYKVEKRTGPSPTVTSLSLLGNIGTNPVLYSSGGTTWGFRSIYTTTSPTVGAMGSAFFKWETDAEL